MKKVTHTFFVLASGGIGGLLIGKVLPKLSLGTKGDIITGSVGGLFLGIALNSFGLDRAEEAAFNAVHIFLHALSGAATVAIVAGVKKLFP